MTQLLVRYSFADPARFTAAFDADAEDRGQSGLSLLQLWRENGEVSAIWALYQVGNAGMARAYLDGAAGVFNTQAGVSAVRTHWLETL